MIDYKLENWRSHQDLFQDQFGGQIIDLKSLVERTAECTFQASCIAELNTGDRACMVVKLMVETLIRRTVSIEVLLVRIRDHICKPPHLDFRVLTRRNYQVGLPCCVACIRQIHIIDGQIVRVLYLADHLTCRSLVEHYFTFLGAANKHFLPLKIGDESNHCHLLLCWTLHYGLTGLVPAPRCQGCLLHMSAQDEPSWGDLKCIWADEELI